MPAERQTGKNTQEISASPEEILGRVKNTVMQSFDERLSKKDVPQETPVAPLSEPSIEMERVLKPRRRRKKEEIPKGNLDDVLSAQPKGTEIIQKTDSPSEPSAEVHQSRMTFPSEDEVDTFHVSVPKVAPEAPKKEVLPSVSPVEDEEVDRASVHVSEGNVEAQTPVPAPVTNKQEVLQSNVEKEEAGMKQENIQEGTKENLQQRIDLLKIEMSEFRQKYAEMDYEKSSAWKTLTGFFRNLSVGKETDPDTDYWKSEYRQKLNELKDLELEQVKALGLKGKDLKERMAGVLQYYKVSEAQELFAARTQVRLERQGFLAKAWGKYEAVVKNYGKLPRAAKIAVSLGLLGLSGVTGGASLVIRRALAGSGAALAVDTLLEKGLQIRENKKAEKEISELVEKEKDSELDLEKMAQLLDAEISSLDKKLTKKRRGALLRKGLALGIGVGIGGGSYLAHALDQHDAVVSGKPASLGTVSTSVPQPTVMEASSSEHGQFATFLQEHKITVADGKKGLWGILEKRLPEDMPKGEKNRVVQSLENAMRAKLSHMSPAEMKAVGIPSGDLDKIHAGNVIHFDKFLSEKEIKDVLGGKSIEAPHIPKVSALHVPPVETAAGKKAILDMFDHKPTAAEQELAARKEIVAEFDHDKAYYTDAKKFLLENPEKLGQFNGTLGRLRMGIFLTRDIEHLQEYDYVSNAEKLGSTKIAAVLKDIAKFDQSAFSSYDRDANPLHYSQMLELKKFLQATEKAFGGLAQVEAGESIDQYTRRMATMALRTGKAIPGFYKP